MNELSLQPPPSDKQRFLALFGAAGIRYKHSYEIPNRYWPEAYAELRAANPWLLVITVAGPVMIGMRKRVISINWQATEVRKVVTEDDVTKDDTYVHAWSYDKALVYLTTLAPLLNETPDSETMAALRKFLDAAVGEGLELDGVDAAHLYRSLYKERKK
jgi:hypothetical protein